MVSKAVPTPDREDYWKEDRRGYGVCDARHYKAGSKGSSDNYVNVPARKRRGLLDGASVAGEGTGCREKKGRKNKL